MKHLLLVAMFLAASLSGCLSGNESSTDSGVEAVFDYEPSNNIRTGEDIEFDAGSSLPSDGSLTFKWDFTNDGSIDETGRTVTWSYPDAGTYTVKLTVSDGTTSNSQERSITVADADAVTPTADAGSDSPSTDCDGESVSTSNYYIVYICEMNRELSNKRIEASTTVNLDGSESEAGSDDEYIAEWNWDTDLMTDSDGDGDKENDADLTGEAVEWKDVIPGEYKISLTVVNGVGLTATDEVVVYVNYVGRWSDFEIAGNTSNNAIDMNFDFDVVQSPESSGGNGNTIRKAVGELIYPQEDDDCTPVLGTNNCRAKLDLYGFNSTDEEAGNTSAILLDQRQAGDCDSDTDCVWLQFTGSYHFDESQWKDGEWTITLRNEKFNDLQIESLTIRLVYK